MINRLVVLVGGIASVGLALGTAGWETIAVAHPSGSGRRGRLEFRHDAPAASNAGDLVDVAGAGTNPAPVDQPPTAIKPPKPEPKPEPKPVPKAEPDIVSVTDVDLAVVENAFLPDFKVANSIRIHLDPEGVIYWTTAKKQTELSGQKILFKNLGGNSSRAFVIVPDKFTSWQYVKDTLATADNASVQRVYLGVADIENTKTLRLLRVMPASPSAEPAEGDFVISIKNDDGDTPVIEIDGKTLESFPIDLALAWSAYKKAHPDADTTYSPNTNVNVAPHRFTQSSHVAQVIGVLRGLGIEAERFVGSTTYAGRKPR